MKTFLAVVVTLFLSLFAVAGGVWLLKEPIAVKVCSMAVRNVTPDECIKGVAVFLSKPSLCEKVTGRDFKFENPPKAQCISDIAVATNDITLCQTLEGGGFVSATPTTCLASVARKWDNAAACASITQEESRMGSVMNKDACMKMIGKTEADVASAPPKKGPAPIFMGLGAGTFDLIAYVLIGLWAVWIVALVAMAARKGKSKGTAGATA
ncbi:MAG TPA: hypothetical protein VL500_06030 [Candidatus Eisenbacteria bacterium]|jgi:hypothetical protein|nr:hypothetical protein [Candidatus Eisenbacteria bacterium]